MSKKKLALICLLLVCVMAFAACTYAFDALSGDTSGEITYKGNAVIIKGNYTYFINGAVDYSMSNNFGEVVKGALARVKTADIGTENELVEIVAPKIMYTASKDSPCFTIIGETLYYSSPSTTKDKNSVVQRNKLDIMSARLDGTNTKRLFTLDSNSTVYQYLVQDNNVYLVFIEDSKLYSVNLSASSPKKVELAENVTAMKPDVNNNVMYFTQSVKKTTSTGGETDEPYNLLKKMTPAGQASELKSGKKDTPLNMNDGDSFSLISVVDGKLYYSVTNSVTGLKVVRELSGNDERVVINTTIFSTFLLWNSSKLVVFDGEGIKVVSYDQATQTYNVRVVTVIGSATLLQIQGDILYFESSSQIYSCNLNDTRKAAKVLMESTTSVSWVNMDIITQNGQVVIYFFNSTATLGNYMYRAFLDEDDDIVEKRLALLTEEDQETEEEEN